MPYWYIWLPVLGLIFFLFYLLAWADYLEKETYLCRLVEDDNKRLKAEVERLRLLPSVEEEIVAWSVDLHDAREEIRRLKGEVERLRLTPDEREFLALLAKHQPVAGDRETLLLIVKRLGGAE